MPKPAEDNAPGTESGSYITVPAADAADAWHQVVPRPAAPRGQWIGVDGPISGPPADDEPVALLGGSSRWGSYGRGLARRIVVGRLGEIAVDQWFRRRGHTTERLFADVHQRAAADLLVDPAVPLEQHPRYAPPWWTPAQRVEALAKRGEPLLRLRPSLAAMQAWVDTHGTRGPVKVEKTISRPGHRDGVEVWPSDSVEVVDADGRRRHVRYLTEMPPQVRFDDLAVEIKTWSSSTWPAYGRHITADQLLRIVDKAEVIIWCRLLEELPQPKPDEPPPGEAVVELAGWNSVRDLVDHGEPVWTTPVRAQLHLPADRVRPMHELTPSAQLTLPTWPRQAASRLRGFGGCGHETVASMCWTCAWSRTFDTDQAMSPLQGKVTVSAGTARFYHHPEREQVAKVHGDWPFTAPTCIDMAANVCLSLPSCPGCFGQ